MEQIKLTQKPVIKTDLKEIIKQVEEIKEKALTLAVTPEGIKDAKKLKADINKLFNNCESARKLIKKEVNDPYKVFETEYKQVITNPIKEAEKVLKDQINSIENDMKRVKEIEVGKYFEEYAKSLLIKFVDFYDLAINVTLSASLKKLKEEVKMKLDRIAADIMTIDLVANRNDVMFEYKKDYNLAKAIATVEERIIATTELKQQEDAYVQEKEIMEQQTIEVESFAKPVVEEVLDIKKMTFTVYGNINEFKDIKNYLESKGIRYE